jgi:uncharacterized membrane protein
MQRLSRKDVALPLALGCCLPLVLGPIEPLRVVAGVALVLAFPGFALMRALLGDRGQWPERLLVTLAATTVLVAVGGLFLDALGFALDRGTWAFLLVAFAAAGWTASIFRRRPRTRHTGAATLRPTLRDALLIAVSLSVFASALVLGSHPLKAPAATPGYTAMWLQSDTGRRVIVHVASNERRPTAYQVLVAVDGQVIAARSRLALSAGAEWRSSVPGTFRAGSHVTATLYRLDGRTRSHQRAELTLEGTGPQASGEG